MSNIKILEETYGLWTILKKDENNGGRSICKCKCGTIRSVDNYLLRKGKSKSCGCLERPLRKDLTNKKFNNLLVIKPIIRGKGKVKWLCKCDCGNEHIVSTSNLTTNNVKSCGCLQKKINGFSNHILYGIWNNMMRRCYDINNPAYKRYGFRGIIVEERWHNIENFIIDMGERPLNHSIDRIDNNGNYSKENCRWANSKQQRVNQNTRVILVTINNKTQCVSDWINELKLTREVYNRIERLGWSPEKAILEPLYKNKRRKNIEP